MRTLLVSSSAVLLLAACSSSKESGPTPLEVYSTGVPGEAAATRTQKITAKVLAVDAASRKVTLQAEDGHTEMISCPPEVKRFNEIAVGDNVVVQVQEGILFEYQPPGSAFVAPAAAVTGARTGSDQPPGAGVAGAIQSTVTITSIDSKTRIVQFQDPDGNKYQVKAGPKLAIEKLTVGDRLVATYIAAVAITLDKKATY